jgi:hypothetical protein
MNLRINNLTEFHLIRFLVSNLMLHLSMHKNSRTITLDSFAVPSKPRPNCTLSKSLIICLMLLVMGVGYVKAPKGITYFTNINNEKPGKN